MKNAMKIRTYSELCEIEDFYERFRYLKLFGKVGESTFGFDRYLNQTFYRSKEWRDIRSEVILRDDGKDLGCDDFEIPGQIYVHHMNPVKIDQLKDGYHEILDPEYLICVSFDTHQAIHYGDESLLPQVLVDRFPGDTKLW